MTKNQIKGELKRDLRLLDAIGIGFVGSPSDKSSTICDSDVIRLQNDDFTRVVHFVSCTTAQANLKFTRDASILPLRISIRAGYFPVSLVAP
jgi:hypothetical protein